MSGDLILHHYGTSPFSEKVRVAFGIKQASWQSVKIPPMMPKPDLTALTGAYRKTPVLQVGADIYCDTALIARRLEAEKATPTLFPEGKELVVSAFAQWADSLVFQTAITLGFQPQALSARLGSLPEAAVQAFVADRAALFKGGTAPRVSVEQARSTWAVLMARLVRQLARLYGGRPGTLGMIRLMRHVIAHLAVTGGMAGSDSLIQQVLGHGVAAKLSARLGEGILNGLLTARLGLAAVDVTRPLPFAALPRPVLSDLVKDLLRRAGDDN